jgi:hypothetical protein
MNMPRLLVVPMTIIWWLVAVIIATTATFVVTVIASSFVELVFLFHLIPPLADSKTHQQLCELLAGIAACRTQHQDDASQQCHHLPLLLHVFSVPGHTGAQC